MNDNGLSQKETLLFIRLLIHENERLNSLKNITEGTLLEYRKIRNELQNEVLELKSRLPKRGRGRPRKVKP